MYYELPDEILDQDKAFFYTLDDSGKLWSLGVGEAESRETH